VPEPSLHHIGYVVASIAESTLRWRAALASISESAIFEDEIQRARVMFFRLPPEGAAQVELVEPLAGHSPVARFLEKGGGLHHLCFQVDSLEDQIARMKAEKAILLRHPQPAVAFEGRRIAWMQSRDRLLVEYLERALR
jgi:methylmalonyl-CoA/ethylmalonyl-CoA epimerase